MAEGSIVHRVLDGVCTTGRGLGVLIVAARTWLASLSPSHGSANPCAWTTVICLANPAQASANLQAHGLARSGEGEPARTTSERGDPAAGEVACHLRRSSTKLKPSPSSPTIATSALGNEAEDCNSFDLTFLSTPECLAANANTVSARLVLRPPDPARRFQLLCSAS